MIMASVVLLLTQSLQDALGTAVIQGTERFDQMLHHCMRTLIAGVS